MQRSPRKTSKGIFRDQSGSVSLRDGKTDEREETNFPKSEKPAKGVQRKEGQLKNDSSNHTKEDNNKTINRDDRDGDQDKPTKRRGIVATQFEDVLGEERKLLLPFRTDMITEEALAYAMEEGDFQKRYELKEAKVNYNLQKNRTAIVHFEETTHTKPDELIAELVRRSTARRAALARITKASVNIDDDEDGLEDSPPVLLDVADADGKPQQYVFGSLQMSDGSFYMGSASRNLSQRMDKKIKFERKQVAIIPKTEKVIYSGWTVKRIVSRKRAIASMLESKIQTIASASPEDIYKSMPKSPKSPINSPASQNGRVSGNSDVKPFEQRHWNQMQLDLIGKSREEQLQMLRIAVKEAHEAVKAAEQAAEGVLRTVAYKGNNGFKGPSDSVNAKYLRRKSVSVNFHNPLPERHVHHPALQHDPRVKQAKSPKTIEKGKSVKKASASQRSTQMIRQKVRDLNEAEQHSLVRNKSNLSKYTNTTGAASVVFEAIRVEKTRPDYVTELEMANYLSKDQGEMCVCEASSPGSVYSVNESLFDSKNPYRIKTTVNNRQNPENWIEAALHCRGMNIKRNEGFSSMNRQPARPQTAPARRTGAPYSSRAFYDKAKEHRRPVSARPGFHDYLRAQSKCPRSWHRICRQAKLKSKSEDIPQTTPLKTPQTNDPGKSPVMQEVVNARVEDHIAAIQRIIHHSAAPGKYALVS